MSWYKILKVKPCASYEDLRAAFKRRVLETHPDKGGRASDFRQVMLAFEKALAEKASAQRGETRAPWTFRNEANKSKPRSKAGVPKPCKNRSSRRPRHGGKGGGNRQGALIARLHSYLRQLQREDRRIAIAEKLGERHRVALELWIQANQWGSAPRQSEPDDLPGPDRKPKKAKCGENSKVPPLALEAPVEPQEMGTSKCHPSKGIVARQTRVLYLISQFVFFSFVFSDSHNLQDWEDDLSSNKPSKPKIFALWQHQKQFLRTVSALSRHCGVQQSWTLSWWYKRFGQGGGFAYGADLLEAAHSEDTKSMVSAARWTWEGDVGTWLAAESLWLIDISFTRGLKSWKASKIIAC